MSNTRDPGGAPRKLHGLLLLVGLVLHAVDAVGAVPREAPSDGGDPRAAARYQEMVRTLTMERDALMGTVSELEKTVADLQQQLAGAEARIAQQTEALEVQGQRAEQLSDRAALVYSRLEETVGLYNGLRQQCQQLAAEHQRVADQKTQAEDRLIACTADNAALYEAGVELLDAYRNKGFGALMSGKEPVFQFQRVREENQVQEYEDRLRESRIRGTGSQP